MSWIQENKFTAAVAGGTLAGSIALVVLAMGQSEVFETTNAKLKKTLRKEAELRSVQPYPNEENLEQKKLLVADYEKASLNLRKQFAAYKPDASVVKDFAPDAFSKLVSTYRSQLDAKFKAVNTQLPEGCVYGFEAYKSKFPKPDATGDLNYQLQALDWLFTKLAEQEPTALLNVVRPKMKVEEESANTSRRGRDAEPAYYELPIEIAFRGTEAHLTSFISELANSEEYPFMVTALRVQNEKQTPPTAGDAKFSGSASVVQSDVEASFADAFGDIEEEVEEEVEGAEELATVASDSDETRLLVPVLGQEKVNVFMKVNLILINQSANMLEDPKQANN